MARAMLLSGEHPTLPEAELRALLAVHDPAAEANLPVPRVATVRPHDPTACDAALDRMALGRAWGELWADVPDDPAAFGALALQVGARTDGQGSAAVRAVRVGDTKSPHGPLVVERLGRALAEAGHRIDLQDPDVRIFAWFASGRLFVGRLHGEPERGRFEGRTAERRRHFHPIVLHPRKALALVHLGRAPPGGRVHDPFCGTGGIVLEAALDGHDAWGSDLDPFMVQGTLQALADDGPEPLDGTAFVADVATAAERMENVDAVVCDLPYGVASTTGREPLADLYRRALAAIAEELPPGGRAVCGSAQAELLQDAAREAGLRQVEMHEDYVHKALTRRFGVFINGRGGPRTG